MSTITISNPEICGFYLNNPHLDIVKVNLTFIELFSLDKKDTNVDAHMHDQLVAELAEHRMHAAHTTEQLSLLQTALTAMSQNMCDLKKEYVSEVNSIMTNNALSANEKMSAVLDRNATHLVDRTTILLTDNIPRQHEGIKNQYDAWFKELSVSLLESTNKMTTTSLPEFLASFDQKYNGAIQTVVGQFEERVMRNLDAVKADAVKTTMSQAHLTCSIDDFLAKYNNSSNKGKLGEANLSSVLTKLYPAAECVNTTGTPNSGDFRLVRGHEYPAILIENKDYVNNIDKQEIAKFICDVDTQKTSGVFLSQSSGIAFKHNYQIDFHNGRVLVYVHNCGYCPDKIRAAIDIIDSLEPKLQSLTNTKTEDASTNISQEMMDEINREYQSFLAQKDGIIATVKDYAKKMTKHVEELRLPELDKLLGSKYAYVKTRIFTCEICREFHGHTKQSLVAHTRCCKRAMLAKTTTEFESQGQPCS